MSDKEKPIFYTEGKTEKPNVFAQALVRYLNYGQPEREKNVEMTTLSSVKEDFTTDKHAELERIMEKTTGKKVRLSIR